MATGAAHCFAVVLLSAVAAVACRSDRSSDAASGDVTTIDASDAGPMDDGPTQVPDVPRIDACGALFGRPVARTGLSAEQCRPACGCGTELFEPSEWPPERVNALLAWRLLDPPADLASNPYDTSPPAPVPAVCAIDIVDLATHTYRLHTYDSLDAARIAGAIVTHADRCGLCSTLHDLAVYAGMPDLGQSVRECGVRSSDLAQDVQCLETLGFTHPCAQIWGYNTQNTRAHCLDPCIASLTAPYHLPDGGLNACLACDEQISGPVFKAVAGRTRRNTGIPNAICRPCDEVIRLNHAYP